MVGIPSSPPQVQGLNIILIASFPKRMIVAQKMRLLGLIVRIDKIEHKGKRYKLKSIEFMILAIVKNILEEVLLIG